MKYFTFLLVVCLLCGCSGYEQNSSIIQDVVDTGSELSCNSITEERVNCLLDSTNEPTHSSMNRLLVK